MKVVEFDKENKKIVLSALAALKEKSDEEIAQYITDFKLEKVSVADVKAADAGKFDSSDFNLYEDTKPLMQRESNTQAEEKKEEN
jgi:small subunit ribosomal protein S1